MLIRKDLLSRLMALRIKKEEESFVATGLDIEPYRKRAKTLFSGMIPRSDVVGNEVSTSLFSAKVSDFLWMAQFSLSNNVPMWVGSNSTLFVVKSPINKIFYLPQINRSLMSVAVVSETMKRA